VKISLPKSSVPKGFLREGPRSEFADCWSYPFGKITGARKAKLVRATIDRVEISPTGVLKAWRYLDAARDFTLLTS
jgi:hypothetical protein